jgi:myo-inositol-1(or 4)-monophosphatase
MPKSTRPAAAATGTAASVRPAVETCVRAIGERVAAAQSGLRQCDVRRKAAGDFVTTIDVRSERELERSLRSILPGAGFLGEEGTGRIPSEPLVWVVDPIDGTSNFARGLPHFAVSVALLHRGDPVLAVLWTAPERALYTALRGRGAFRDGRRIRTPRARLDDGAILGCQWHRGQQDLGFVERLQSRGSRIRTLGSTVTQLADVAVGRLDGNVQEQGRLWDIAAAGLLVEEAGGRFTDWSGRRVFPIANLAVQHTPTIAAGPGVHGGLLKLLRPRSRRS